MGLMGLQTLHGVRILKPDGKVLWRSAEDEERVNQVLATSPALVSRMAPENFEDGDDRLSHALSATKARWSTNLDAEALMLAEVEADNGEDDGDGGESEEDEENGIRMRTTTLSSSSPWAQFLRQAWVRSIYMVPVQEVRYMLHCLPACLPACLPCYPQASTACPCRGCNLALIVFGPVTCDL